MSVVRVFHKFVMKMNGELNSHKFQCFAVFDKDFACHAQLCQ